MTRASKLTRSTVFVVGGGGGGDGDIEGSCPPLSMPRVKLPVSRATDEYFASAPELR